ncbi:hypothetical protein BVRB_8g195040 [Beta vulgaris subsp. vulgaris]|nr:hypothetical protein BVRB_8g195040 [Beta vulgaris subsp. vulgaris]
MNMFEEENRNLGSVMGDGCEELNGCSNNERNLNRENLLPSFLKSYALCDWNSMEFQFDGKHMVSVSGCIRSHQFHSSQNGSGKMLVGAKCYPGLGVSKQGQAMKFHHANSSSRSLKGANRSQAIEMKKAIDFDKEITRKQGSEGSVKQSGVFQLSSIDLSSCNPTMSINDIIAKWKKSCSLQEEMQGDPPVTPSIDKVDSRKFPNISNMNDGISSDLASFHTHLSARGLQTIPDADLEYVKELGSGNYGTVYHGKWKGSEVAIK